MMLLENSAQLFAEIHTEILLGLTVMLVLRIIIKYFADRPKIPGPFPWPVIGNAISLGDKPHVAMQNMAKRYGNIYLMKLGSFDVLVLNNYKTIKEALIKKRRVFSGRPAFDSLKNVSQGRSIVFNDSHTMGEAWMQKKQLVIKLLHKFVVGHDTRELLCRQVTAETLQMVSQLDQLCRRSPTGCVEPEGTIQVGIANLVCAMMFGHRYEYSNKEFQDLVSLNREFGLVAGTGNQIDVMPWITVIPHFAKVRKLFNFIMNRTNNWMMARSNEHRQGYVHGTTRAIVDLFIAHSIDDEESSMNQEDITALISDVFGAGQDTLSTVAQWIFLYMIYYPDCQQKVRQELDGVLNGNKLPSVDDRRLFPYTEAVLHELFRHSSLTPNTIPHTTTEDTVVGGYHVPKSTMVFVNQHAANHDPEVWDQPDKFMPERFLEASGKLIPNPHEKYLVFSTGLRKCPGDEISRVILVHFMATFFSVAEIFPDPEAPPTLDSVFNLSMRPKELKLSLRLRDQAFFANTLNELQRVSVPVRKTMDGHWHPDGDTMTELLR